MDNLSAQFSQAVKINYQQTKRVAPSEENVLKKRGETLRSVRAFRCSNACDYERIRSWVGLVLCPLSYFFIQASSGATWESTGTLGKESISVSGTPDVIAIARNATTSLLVVDARDPARLVLIDPASGLQLGNIPLSTLASSIAVDPTGRRIYVASNRTSTVALVDMAANKVIANWPVGGSVSALAFLKNGAEVAATDRASKRVFILNATTGAITRTLTLDVRPTQLTTES